MDEPVDRGLPFELDHLSRQSTFTVPTAATNDLFLPPDVDSLPLQLNQDLKAEDALFNLELASFDEPRTEAALSLGDLESHESVLSDSPLNVVIDDSTHDIWGLDASLPHLNDVEQLRTWEAFEKKGDPHVSRTVYLSEAGVGAFDAALSQSHLEQSLGVLPQDVSFRALCNLALGRSSIFFQWDAEKESFEQTLNDVAISGLSLQCSASFTSALIGYASMYRCLLADVQNPGTTAAFTALSQCVTEILDSIEASLSSALPVLRSLLQLLIRLEVPQQLVSNLSELMKAARPASTEEQALSVIADHVSTTAERGSSLASVMQTVLTRVAQPWVQSLQEDLGLADRGFSSIDSHTPEDILSSSGEVDLSLDYSTVDAQRQSHFVDENDRQLIGDTKACLKVARQCLNDCTTCILVQKSPDLQEPSTKAGLSFGQDRALGLGEAEIDAWVSGEAHSKRIGSLYARMSDEPSSALSFGHLGEVTAALLADRGASPPTSIGDPSSLRGLDYLAEIRPAIEARRRGLNRKIVLHMLRAGELRKHLNLQRSFHLLGSGDFATRLSTALFSSETQSAERTRGTIPTSDVMGLRLGARAGQRWPPASSELRLSLMGVLDDARQSTSTDARRHDARQSDGSGGLSFAIRELSDEEIDRVMDPTSIHALDFLKLQYAAPAPVDYVLTPASLQRYDEIFRFLLQLLRIQDVTTRVRKDALSASRGRSSVASRKTLELYHVSSAIMAYFMNVGISAPWKKLMAALDGIEEELSIADTVGTSPEGTNLSIAALRELHDACLETMRGRLFLRRKQTKIRSALEEVFGSILTAAASLASADELPSSLFGHRMSQFKAAVSRLVILLQESVDRPLKVTSARDTAENESDTIKLLLSQLDWNHTHSRDAYAVTPSKN